MSESNVSHGRCPRRAATAEPCVFCGDHSLERAVNSLTVERGPKGGAA